MTNSNSSSPSKTPALQQQQQNGTSNGGGNSNPNDPFKIALIQLNTQEDKQWNIKHCSELIRQAAAEGAELIITPENTGRMSSQFRYTDTCGEKETAQYEYEHTALREYRRLCQELQVHLLIGSLAVRVRGNDKRVANRSYLLVPNNQAAPSLSASYATNLDIPRRQSTTSQPSSRQSSGVVDIDDVIPEIIHH